MGLSHQSAHPCPLCLIPNIDIYALGSRQDTDNRLCKARIDVEDYVRLVKRSRKNMFENEMYWWGVREGDPQAVFF